MARTRYRPPALDVETSRRSASRAALLAAPSFPLFLLLDAYVRAARYPDASLALCAAVRVAGFLALVGAGLLLRRPGWSAAGVRAVTALTLGLLSAGLGVISVDFGGLESAYATSIVFFGLTLAAFLAADWRRLVLLTTPTVVGADLDPGPDRIRDWNGALVPRLVEGTNAVHVWITIDCGYGQDDDPIVAKGDLTIEVKKGALDAYAKKYGPFLPKARHPESRAVGAKLAAAVAREWPNEDVVGSGVLVSPGWFVQRDEWTGVPVARSSDAWVVVHLKEQPLATVCRAFNGTARQAAMDGRRFSPDVELGGTGGNVDVPCAAAKLPGR